MRLLSWKTRMASTPFRNTTIGASGAIFGIMGALAAIRPRMTIYVSFVPMPMAVAVLLWAAGDLIGLFAPSNVANAAHLFGLAFGIIIGLSLREKHKDSRKKRDDFDISEEEFEDWEDNWM